MKSKIFYGLFVFTILLILNSCSSEQNNKSTAQKEKISFTNIKYLDTIQNTKPAEGIPEVDVDYWMKTVFKGIKGVKDGKGYLEFEDATLNEFLKATNKQGPGLLKKNISASNIYYCTVKKEPHAVIFFHLINETPPYIEISPTSFIKDYEFNNSTLSILELQFTKNKWNLKKHTENLRNCISINQSHTGTFSGWNFEFTLPRLLILESEHYFIFTDLKENHRYFENKDTCKIFSIGNFETPAISWESINEFSFKDFDSTYIESTVSYYKLQDFKPYKKTENIKFFLDKGILHAEITQDGFIYDPEKEKEIPQNAKTYYRYSEEKKIFTKLE